MTARSLICIMSIEDALKLNAKIIGRAQAVGYECKCLVNLGLFIK